MSHPILQRQLRKLGLSPEAPPDPQQWGRFLERVAGSYASADLDRYTLERSLHLSSAEMRELTQQLQRALEQLRRLSMTDDLTGLMNRRFLKVTIHEELAQVLRNYRQARGETPERLAANVDLAFIMVDIDHFKQVNDEYGHAVGDEVLVQLCQILSSACRGTDTVIRWGGEEFLVLARNFCREDLDAICERIRSRVAGHPFETGIDQTLHLTCSLGGAVFPFLREKPSALRWERVVDFADACLYAAKRSGRNAWVWVLATGKADPEDFEDFQPTRLQELVETGRLEVRTNLHREPALS
nr:GGDEF domain-containing protein [uncultured Holophaga sp.]